MPRLKKLTKKKKTKRVYNSKKDNLNHMVYNSKRWRDLRIEKLTNNPLCERCDENDVLTLADQVHHKQPISTGVSLEEKCKLGYDYNNLMSVCDECHKEIHNEL